MYVCLLVRLRHPATSNNLWRKNSSPPVLQITPTHHPFGNHRIGFVPHQSRELAVGGTLSYHCALIISPVINRICAG
jgi:hypothetical protein